MLHSLPAPAVLSIEVEPALANSNYSVESGPEELDKPEPTPRICSKKPISFYLVCQYQSCTAKMWISIATLSSEVPKHFHVI